jgi:hypothetical protein
LRKGSQRRLTALLGAGKVAGAVSHDMDGDRGLARFDLREYFINQVFSFSMPLHADSIEQPDESVSGVRGGFSVILPAGYRGVVHSGELGEVLPFYGQALAEKTNFLSGQAPLLLKETSGNGLVKLDNVRNKGGTLAARALKKLYAADPDIVQAGFLVMIVPKDGFPSLAAGWASYLTHDKFRKLRYT